MIYEIRKFCGIFLAPSLFRRGSASVKVQVSLRYSCLCHLFRVCVPMEFDW